MLACEWYEPLIRYEDLFVFCSNKKTWDMVVGCCVAGDGPFLGRYLKTYRCKIVMLYNIRAIIAHPPGALFE